MTDLASPSRRAIVRGAAWSVPVVAVAATAPAFAASPCATTYSFRLDWGTTTYRRTDARNATASVTSVGATPLTVTFTSTSSSSANVPDPNRNLSVPPNTGTATTADPVVTSLGGRAGERGVMLYHASSTPGRANRQDVAISFSRPVRGLKFWITDIDTIASPAYSDRVELVGYTAAGAIVPFSSTNDGITGSGSAASPWLRTSDANVSENAGGAQTLVDFSASTAEVKSLVLTYWNNAGGTQYHRVFVGDLEFTALGC